MFMFDLLLVVCSGLLVISRLNSGKTAEAVPRSFSEWDHEGFMKNVMKQFAQYLVETVCEWWMVLCTFFRIDIGAAAKTGQVRPDLTNSDAVCITTNSAGDTSTTVLSSFSEPSVPAPAAKLLQEAPIRFPTPTSS
jgi:hypothetical protein